MATELKNLSVYDPNNVPSCKGMKFGMVVSEYNDHITLPLRDGAVATILEHGGTEEDITVVYVPGAYELTSGADILIESGEFDAVLCLGCVIKGETDHDIYINTAVANGITTLSMATGVPVQFGLLTPNTEQQAIDRAGGKHGNKGIEVAIAAIKMAALKRGLIG